MTMLCRASGLRLELGSLALCQGWLVLSFCSFNPNIPRFTCVLRMSAYPGPQHLNICCTADSIGFLFTV